MAYEPIKSAEEVVLWYDKETDTYAYSLLGRMLMEGLPEVCKPMLEKSFKELVAIRKKDREDEERKKKEQ